MFCKESVSLVEEDCYKIATLNKLAQKIDTAIVTYRRYGTEEKDRILDGGENPDEWYEEHVGYFYPSKKELQLFEQLEKSDIQNVVLILNVSSTVDFSFIEKFPKIKSVLLTYLPGLEGGTAIADVLCGDVNPSGRLVDTIAYRYEDYPSSENFNSHERYTEYKEGIYVGYRYFETFAKEKVLYPFGYGLSYTEFEFINPSLEICGEKIKASVTIKNTGCVFGREVVQLYVKAPENQLPKPVIELKGFAKTKGLAPGETEKITITFDKKEMASFDDAGITGFPSAWVMEMGNYSVYVGKHIRDLYLCGEYVQEETVVTEQLSARFRGERYEDTCSLLTEDFGNDKGYLLHDVSEGKITMEEFVGQLTVDEMISLASCQPPAFPQGTGGIGNLKSKGIPNPQTADGPAGIRRSVNTTCFPCGTLLATSWDTELQYAMGSVLGEEGYCTEVDIILAPAMNIHRNPLCGRNFEYLSEDPVVTGKTAAAIVRGIQSEGMCATIKHFAVNNCEYNRKVNDSIVDERTLREIYLRGFQIAIKDSNPAFVMTSYNRLNGKNTSVHAQLLNGVLRDEWKYEGAVMTDWRNYADLDDEIIAGNNVKMPFGYPDQIEKARNSFAVGKLTLAQLQRNSYYVLKAIMKTRSFQQKDFGKKHVMTEQTLKISAIDAECMSGTMVRQAVREDGKEYLYHLNIDVRAQRTYVDYKIVVNEAGNYKVSAEFSTDCPEFEIWYMNKRNECLGVAKCDMAKKPDIWYMTTTSVLLKKGENTLRVVFVQEPDKTYELRQNWDLMYVDLDEDIKLVELTIEK